ncbi:hypothetical protein HAX54_050897 [Datura stramonium]|uniref:Uncharacterized protein n=1 Tax=Datura stramonium TaxID=4076 RepID=A0ABS8SX18_DATST|nr:hypothetical protein [Datura stramonium]
MISHEEEEHEDGEKDHYENKPEEKHSAKSLKPIAKVLKYESLLWRNDRKLPEKKKVEIALKKLDDDEQDDCTNPNGKKNGQVTIRSDKGKNKKVDGRRKHFSTDVRSFALLQI